MAAVDQEDENEYEDDHDEELGEAQEHEKTETERLPHDKNQDNSDKNPQLVLN